MNQVVGDCLCSLGHSAGMSLQVVNRELMMSHLHRMTSYSRTQQMIDPAHPLMLFIVQVCKCIIAHVHLCVLCMSMCVCCAVCCAALCVLCCVLRCVCCAVCCAVCVVLCVLCCVCCAALHLFMMTSLSCLFADPVTIYIRSGAVGSYSRQEV